MKVSFKSYILIWILIVSVLPLFKEMNPFVKLTILVFPLIFSRKYKQIFPPTPYIILFIFTYLFASTNGNANFVGIFCLILLPILCINKMRTDKLGANILRVEAVILYLINCAICIVEYNLHVNFLSYDLSYFDHFRATGLWIHPLFNALITCICMLFILLSNMQKHYKIALYIIGIYTMFTFDARAATIMLLASSIYILYTQRVLKIKYGIYIVIFLAVGYNFYNYLVASDMGGKLLMLSEDTLSEDSSTMARLVALDIFFDSSWRDLLCGVRDKEAIFNSYGIIAIENSFIDLTLTYGLITSFSFFILYTKELNNMMIGTLEKKYRYLVITTFILVGMACTALTEYFVWLAFITFFYGFFPYNKSQY